MHAICVSYACMCGWTYLFTCIDARRRYLLYCYQLYSFNSLSLNLELPFPHLSSLRSRLSSNHKLLPSPPPPSAWVTRILLGCWGSEFKSWCLYNKMFYPQICLLNSIPVTFMKINVKSGQSYQLMQKLSRSVSGNSFMQYNFCHI